MEPLPVVYFASSFLNGFNAEGVGMKLTCDVNAANAKRMRFPSNTGVRHFTPSVAPGAAFLRMAYISRRFLCDALGAALMYSAMVVGLGFDMADTLKQLRSKTFREHHVTFWQVRLKPDTTCYLFPRASPVAEHVGDRGNR